MKKITKDFVLNNIDFIISEIKVGKIFIYPTDTVYGIGCDATNSLSVSKIYEIKKRENKPLLIIVPSKNWIYENLDVKKKFKDEIESKLPGPFSFVCNLKNKKLVCGEVLGGRDSLGVRIPKCFFSEIIEKINLPFVTTSVNFSGKPSAIKVNEIDCEILKQVDYLIEDDLALSGKSSTILDLRGEEILKLR